MIRRPRTALALAIAAGLALVGLVAPPAQAGSCTVIAGIYYCGDVYHHPNSDRSTLQVGCSWMGSYQYVSRGSWATCRDADGFVVPSGCYGRWWQGRAYQTYGAGWNKVYDNQDVSIELVC